MVASIIPAYMLLGLFAGLLAGLFGIGGGVVLVPAFIVLFQWQGFDPQIIAHMAIGSSLACIVFSSISSTWAHHRRQAVMWPVFIQLCLGIVVGVMLGVRTVTSISGDVLQLIIGAFLVLMALKMVLNFQSSHVGVNATIQQESLPNKFWLSMSGGVIGFVSALFGIGGGSLTVPFLQHHGVVMKRAVATSAACGIPIAFAGAISNMLAAPHELMPEGAVGYVYAPGVIAVGSLTIVGAWIGVRLAHYISAKRLKNYFAYLIGVIGIWLLINQFI